MLLTFVTDHCPLSISRRDHFPFLIGNFQSAACSGDALADLQIPFFFGEYTATVLLDIHAKLSCLFLSGAEVGAEISVQERYPIGFGGFLGGFLHKLVILIGADKQGRSKAVKATFLCGLGGGKEAHFIAFYTASRQILRHLTDEGAQGIFVPLNQLQTDGLRIFSDTVPSGTVLREGMDIGIVPEARNFDPLLLQGGDTLIGARGTANM